MNRHRGRALAATALVAGVLMVSGCAAGPEAHATSKRAAETSTTNTVDAAIAAIDPSLIDHVDLVLNTSAACLGADGTPQATVSAWENMRYVWLVSGNKPLDVADALVKKDKKDGWTTARTGKEVPGKETAALRTVSLVPSGNTDNAPGLKISAGSNTAVPPVLYLSSTSTCGEDAP